MTDNKYLVVLSSFVPFGPARIKLLVKFFGSAKKVWQSSRKDLVKIGLKENIVREFIGYRDKFNVKDYFDKLEKFKIDYIVRGDNIYPDNLRDLDDAPEVLYVRGKLSKSDNNAVAIVGSRKMTSYGWEVTRKLSTELAGYGITIVSGLAFGVDLEAHKAALDVKGRCIAVLASGVDMITPRSNEWLGIKIIRSKTGAIVSEFPLGLEAQRYFFPFRNRIISGLSKATIIIEGRIKSGTIHTAKHALNQGRAVFAVPGQITSPMSELPNYLIKNGAKMITSAKDVLEELDLQLKVDKEAVSKLMPSDETEQKVVDILVNEAMHLDEIGRITGLNISQVSEKLTVMELKGMIKHLGGGIYKKI